MSNNNRILDAILLLKGCFRIRSGAMPLSSDPNRSGLISLQLHRDKVARYQLKFDLGIVPYER